MWFVVHSLIVGPLVEGFGCCHTYFSNLDRWLDPLHLMAKQQQIHLPGLCAADD
jgi:hypothetical protein